MRPHPATQDDLDDLRKLLHACALDCDGIEEQIDRFLVVRDISGLIACACAQQYGQVCVLKVIAVIERARSSGLGELLLGALVTDIRQRGAQALLLRTRSASGFFSKLGFTAINPADVPSSVHAAPEFSRSPACGETLMLAAL
jgi:amino-acid N-acetyltransferase